MASKLLLLLVVVLLGLSGVRGQVGVVGTDYSGNDLSSTTLPSSATSNDCANLCAETTGCQGWAFVNHAPGCETTNICWLKSALGTATSNNCRISGHVSGGIVGVDHTGSDLSSSTLSVNATASDCARLCLTTSGCQGWAFVRPGTGCETTNTCWLKSALGASSTNACRISGIVPAGTAGVDHPGSDLSGSPLTLNAYATSSDCARLCTSTAGCHGWAFVNHAGTSCETSNLCWLKSASSNSANSNACRVSGSISTTTVQRGGQAVNALMSTSWYNNGNNQWRNVAEWHSANCLTALCEFASRTNNGSFTSLYSRSLTSNALLYLTDGYDDEGWWALAWLDIYNVTKDSKYLTEAETIFTDMAGAWDTTVCGGGVWWDRARTYKNAITNELFLSIAAKLYQFTGTASYLTYAKNEWNWFYGTGMINSQYLINDGLLSTCGNNGGTTWTYNQGVILGGLVSLYQITNNATHLTIAENIADATILRLTTNQRILQETCDPGNTCNGDQVQFKGVFMRNLGYLYQATRLQRYADFISSNADSIWYFDRSGNQFGEKWAGAFDSADPSRQSSALDAFNAALLL